MALMALFDVVDVANELGENVVVSAWGVVYRRSVMNVAKIEADIFSGKTNFALLIVGKGL